MLTAAHAAETWREKVSQAIAEIVLPVGLFALLTGMLWAGSPGLYPKLYQFLVALPVLVLIAVRPRCVIEIVGSPIVRWVLAFFGLALLSLLWAQPEDDPLSLVRRPFMVVLVFLAANEVFSRAPRRFELVLRAALVVASCAAAYSLARFVLEGAQGRLSGYGALYNPLLVSHVFGFFAAFATGRVFLDKRPFPPALLFSVSLLFAVLLATGSRTPLMAMAATLCWLVAMTMNRKAAMMAIALTAVALLTVLVWPEVVLQRGLSYRPQIWLEAFRQITAAPWFGHGFDSPLSIKLADLGYSFVEPHNLILSVTYDLGIVGAGLWLGMYLAVFVAAWKLRAQPYVVAVSAIVVYGLIAGMTEGGAFLSRPKEHWFLVWIPIALFAAVARGNAAASEKP